MQASGPELWQGGPTGLSVDEERGLKAEILELFEAYCWVVDEWDFNSWPEFFTDDAMYNAISRENFSERLPHATLYCDGKGMLQDRAAALLNTSVYETRFLRHFLSGLRIRSVRDGEIRTQANFMVTECLLDRDPRLFAAGIYHDRLVRVNGALKFRERLAVFDNYRIITSLIAPL